MNHHPVKSLSETENPEKRHTSDAGLGGNAKLRRLNERHLLRFQNACKKALEEDADANLGPLYQEHTASYLRLRRLREKPQSQRDQDDSFPLPLPPSNSQTEQPTQCAPVVVTYPLDRKVEAMIGNETTKDLPSAEDPEDLVMISRIDALIKRGKQLYASGGRTVTQITSDIVVKTGERLDLNEMTTLEHIHRASKSFPSPRPLGSVLYNGVTYFFMTLVEGTSLQELWPSLRADQKIAARDQLSTILLDLRNLPLPSTQIGGGIPTRCKDVRRSIRSSSGPVYNEDDFNDFLLSTIIPRVAQTYQDFIRTKCLHSRHRIVMTHGDLHPRNIMAALHDGHVEIKGIVDWEAAGAYPEYWEYVKSLNTMSSVDEEDWCHYLPVEGMGEHCKEWAVDMVLETIVV